MLHFFLILRYTMHMKAFTANKDVLFTLHAIQKDILSFCNKDKVTAIPAFPLWAFCEDDFFDGTITRCVIQQAQFDKEKKTLFFPVDFTEDSGNTKTLNITFATVQNTEEITLPQVANLPISINTFRTGTVLVTECSWQLYDEKWIKIKN